MSDRFWIGGSGNWNDTAHWSTSSGGSGGASVPSSSDNAIFDALSNTTAYTVTINVAADCLDLNFSAAPAVSGTITWAGSSAMNIYGSLVCLSGMTRSYTGAITFKSTSTGKTITSNAVVLASAITFNGVGGGWTLQDAFNIGTSLITLTNGAFDTNDQTVTAGAISSSNSNTRTLDLGASAINLSQAGTPWEFSTTTNLTFIAGTSTITLTSNTPTFSGGGLTYYALVMSATSNANPIINGANTFTNLTRTHGANKSDSLILGADQTVSGTFTVTGNSAAINRLKVESSVIGTQRTITAAAVALTNCDFEDIIGAGAASWSGTSVGNCGNNSGITFTTPVTRYWVGTSGGNFSSTSNWSASSGGASGASVPIVHDTAIIDANSITSGSRTITIDLRRIGNINATGVLNSPNLSFANTMLAYGDINLGGCTPTTGSSLFFQKRSGTQQITSNGKTWAQPMTLQTVGSAWTLADDFISSTTVTHSQGGMDLNDMDFTALSFDSSNSNVRSLSLGSGTCTLTGTGTVWTTFTSSNLTFNPETSTIKLTNSSASTKTFAGGGLTFNRVWFSGTGSGLMNLTGANTFDTLKADPGLFVRFPAGVTNTITTLFDFVGVLGQIITITSSSAGSAATLSKASGQVCCDYLSLKDSAATGGAPWHAGVNSSFVSGNSGWELTNCANLSARNLKFIGA